MLIIGHRGAKGLAPENTIAGFRTALKHHVDAIEFDVRTTADGKAIAIHDDSLKRTVSKDIKVSVTAYENLMKYDGQLTTLEEVLDFLPTQTPIVLEIKRGADLAPII